VKSTSTSLNFAIQISRGPAPVIALSGELDIATVPIFKAGLAEIEFSSIQRVGLDLEQLAFIDVAGIRTVLGLQATCLKEWVALTIKPGPRTVQRVFEITQTDWLLPFGRDLSLRSASAWRTAGTTTGRRQRHSAADP
jgi:anti-anti-sigma factor